MITSHQHKSTPAMATAAPGAAARLDRPPVSTLSELVRWRAAVTPSSVAVTFLRDDRSEDALTFSSLDATASGVAAALTAMHLPTGSRILLAMLPGRANIGSFFGVIRAGMIAVPVPPPLPGGLADRFAVIAADCSPALTLTSDDLKPLLLGAAATDAGPVISVDRLPPACHPPTDRCQAGDPVLLQYTSGTTGTPRGAVVTNTQALTMCAIARDALRLTPATVVVQWLPEWHDMGLLAQVLLPVYGPYGVHVMSPAAFAGDPVRLLEEMSARNGYGAAMPYGAYEILAKRAAGSPPSRVAGLCLAGWKCALSGADNPDPARLRQLTATLAAWGLPPTALHAAYGSAESNIICIDPPGAGLTIIRADYQALVRDGRVVPAHRRGVELAGCGEPAPGMQLAVLDPQGRQRGAGEIGEIAVGGDAVATSYWQQPAAAAVVDGRAMLLTGDIGAMLHGQLFHLGRKSDVVTDNQGRKHPACLIERAAARAHPAVRVPALAAFTAAGKAVLVAETRHTDSAGEVAVAISAAVSADCGLWLDDVVIVPPKSIPVTTSNKVRRAAVRQSYRRGDLTLPALSEIAS